MDRRTAFTTLLALALAACQQGASGLDPKVSAAYREDVARVCDVMTRSGADQLPEEERVVATAMWLGENLRTEEGRDLLVRFQQADDKAALLRAEAKAAGLAGCPLAARWE